VVATAPSPRRIEDAEGLAEFLKLRGGMRAVCKLLERTRVEHVCAARMVMQVIPRGIVFHD
jgi:hypothetical protein